MSHMSLPKGRFAVENLLDDNTVAELKMIHRICCTPGYREHYTSTLFSCTPPWAFRAYITARDTVREAAEELFELPFRLCVETSGTAGWMQGASIAPHADNARDYLKHRHVSAVVFLNAPGDDTFEGGDFVFCDEPVAGTPTNLAHTSWPAPVTPAPGTCVLFSSGDETMHCVTPVKRGTRYSMLFWLSTDRSAGEDAVVLSIMKKLRAPVQMYFDERVFGMGPQATWDYTRDPHLVHNSLAAVGLTVCGDDVCSIGSNNMEGRIYGPVAEWRSIQANRAYVLYLQETTSTAPVHARATNHQHMYAMSDGVKVHGSRCNSVVESQENHGANELEGDFVCGDEDDGVLPVRETVAADASGLVGTHTAVGDVGGRIDASLAAFLVTAEREYNRQLPDWVINSEIVHF